MTKPANFPERKRQRQLRALARLSPMTRGSVRHEPRSNDAEFVALHKATAEDMRGVRTKINRSADGRFNRTA
jgi:hypothetical protein